MLSSESLGNEALDWLANQFGPGPPEEAFSLVVHKHNLAVGVDRQ
jgi:hypothetical protein